MCDDPDPDDLWDDEDDPERDALSDELHGALFGDLPQEERLEGSPPTPGERLLYALGQLDHLHRRRRFPFDPRCFDMEDLARVLGIADELEFVMEDRNGSHYHFPSEVLVVRPEHSFPWRLLTVWEWTAEQYLNSL